MNKEKEEKIMPRMYSKIHDAIVGVFQKEGYMVRQLTIINQDESFGMETLDRDFIGHFSGDIIIRAQKSNKRPK